MSPWDDLSQRAHALAVSKGWWDYPLEERIPLLMDWIKEEAEEAKQAFLERGFEEWYEIDSEGHPKPEGFRFEISDILLLLFDTAEGTDTDILLYAIIKLGYNEARKYRRDARGNKIDG